MESAKLLTEVLESGGKVQLSTLLAALVPVEELRELARKFGLTPKGGYRLQRAPADVVAPLLALSEDAQVVGQACDLLVRHMGASGGSPVASDVAAEPSLQPMLRLKEQELERLQSKLEKARRSAAREREKEAARSQELETEREHVARLRAEIRALQRAVEGRQLAPTSPEEQEGRIRELEHEVEVLAESEEGLRRRAAEQAARVRGLESALEDLEARVPKGRRARKKPPPEPPREPFRIPYFTPSFYKSLEGRERRYVERAVQAVLLFCAEGPSYPGLEVKQLEGQSLWSLRASLKLRVYFSMRDDGGIDVLALVDRADQRTTLRKWRGGG